MCRASPMKGGTLKALSVMPEPALYIALGLKPIEYRTWKTPYRGDLLICASSKRKAGFIDRHALCVASLDDITFDLDVYEWHLSNIRLVKPFEVKGKLHIYEVPDSKIQYLPNTLETLERYFKPLVYNGRDNVPPYWQKASNKQPYKPKPGIPAQLALV